MEDSTRSPSPEAVRPPSPTRGLPAFGSMLVRGLRDDARDLFTFPKKKLPAFDAFKDADREMDRIAILHDMRERTTDTVIDDATWTDLDFDRVFANVDRCISPMGEQCLYDVLRTPAPDIAPLEQRDRIVRHLADSPHARNVIRTALAPLRTGDAYYLPNLFLAQLPERPRLYFVFPALTALAIAFFAMLFVNQLAGLIGLFAVIVTNLVIQYRYHNVIKPITRPLTLVAALLRASDAIVKLEDEPLSSHVEHIRIARERLKPIRKTARYLSFERSWDDVTAGLYTYLNAFLLLDVNAFAFSLELLRANRDSLASLYETLGDLDAAVSIAGYRASIGTWCKPDLNAQGRSLDVVALRHPLVPDAVANDLHIDGRSILITGSNMAGKTTFIRAIALNAILAETIYTCTATKYRAPMLHVRTMIGRGDDLAKGQSYFAAELDMSHALVNAASSPHQHLFAIDEIFRGTNTTERVAAARAVLHALAAGNHIVLAATHDLELLHLLDQHWEFYHFRESVNDGKLEFDYRIHQGPASTHNAIRMMEVYGFPPDVVADARRVADILTRRTASWE